MLLSLRMRCSENATTYELVLEIRGNICDVIVHSQYWRKFAFFERFY